MFSIHDETNAERFRHLARLDPARFKEVRNDFLKFSLGADVARARLTALGVSSPSVADIEWHALERIERRDSQLDGATKLLFKTPSGERIESVMLRYATGRLSLCVSSQAGCAAACGFCATGKMGLVRSLTTSEILDQIVQANELARAEEARVRNIVFMGMGEPFHNEENVSEALRILSRPDRFDYSPQRLLVSTVGVPEAMVRFARRFPKVNLALSLHSALQDKRESLIPLARRAPLDSLRATLLEVNAIQRRPVMIEYLLLAGWNDGDDDLEALATWIEGLDVHVNLIPYNAIEAAPDLVGTEKERRESFGAALKARGHKVTLRYSLGRDIAAACGQLVREESRRRVAKSTILPPTSP